MSASGSLVALRVSATGRRQVVVWPRTRARGSRLSQFSGHDSSALQRTAPGALVTLSGLHGGAGTSTATLLLSTAVTAASDRAVLAVDAAGLTGGGLGMLAGCWSQAPAAAVAEIVVEGGSLAQPYVCTPAGVHLVGARPDAVAVSDSVGHRVAERLEQIVRGGGDDHQLAAACRDELSALARAREYGDWIGCGARALRTFIRSARVAHSLIAVDLGIADAATLAAHTPDADLHVWVLAVRPAELAGAQARLVAQPPVTVAEAVLAWVPDGQVRGIGQLREVTRQLRALSEARSCPVVKLPTVAEGDWPQRADACAASMDALCRLLD